MIVAVVGLWHLGTVTAACLASAGHHVVGVDDDAPRIARLTDGHAPLFEPGLDDLLRDGGRDGRLRFTSDPSAVHDADVVWITFDTPVDEDDRADVGWVVDRTAALFPHLRDDAVVLVSSQMPVGSVGRLEHAFARLGEARGVSFAYSPENLRLGAAIDAFRHPERVVVGVRSEETRARLEPVWRPFASRIDWMTVESAEMTKHALNAFLATSVTFINEVAALCEQVGADASDVARALKSDGRIGPRAYLSPGAAFAGGTLARDVVFLSQLAAARGLAAPVLTSVKASNDAHREWPQRRLLELLGVEGRTVAIWGLTYKPGTDTLRRSSAVELCAWLHERGARVRAHDPAVRALPASLTDIVELVDSPLAAADGADALVVATPWPVYREMSATDVADRMAGNLVLDAARFLAASFEGAPQIRYVSVGRSAAS